MENTVVYEEMGQKVADSVQIECRVSYSSKFYITTDLDLKGRGIKAQGDGSDHKRGKKTYLVTEKAMDKLKATYSCCFMANL